MFAVIAEINTEGMRPTLVTKAVGSESIPASVPVEYRRYTSIFQKEFPTKLPEQSLFDHRIGFLPDKEPRKFPMFPMSSKKLQALHEFLDAYKAARTI